MIIGIVFLVLVGLFIVGLFPALVDIWVETFGHGARYSRAVRDHEVTKGDHSVVQAIRRAEQA